ncbi:MAG: hypothetical protein M3O84_07600, partial [Actinomycetota bacterium]|nr:hypothetical protein [Actinomycetota bacterium]
TELFAGSISDGERLFTIDENTAIVGDGRRWTTVGSGAARILESGSWRTFPSGEGFSSDPVGERTRSREAAS